jgi:endonuclease/exonuclease/phosphatase family metal-dependent hydrolase
MRMATFNILHGRSVHDGLVHRDRLVDAIRQLDPDILALQEVDLDQPRSGMADLTAVAAVAMDAESHRFVAAYGIALLSRYPVDDWQVVRLPRIPMKFPMYLRGPNRVQVVNEEPRAAVIARLDTPVGPLTVANTHLSFVPGWNRRQMRLLMRDLRGFPGPHVLMGDLNMAPSRVGRLSGLRALGEAPTFPADVAETQLDHILTDDDGLRVDSCSAPRLPISDHRALVVDISRR